jgi:hypothetical protein
MKVKVSAKGFNSNHPFDVTIEIVANSSQDIGAKIHTPEFVEMVFKKIQPDILPKMAGITSATQLARGLGFSQLKVECPFEDLNGAIVVTGTIIDDN